MNSDISCTYRIYMLYRYSPIVDILDVMASFKEQKDWYKVVKRFRVENANKK